MDSLATHVRYGYSFLLALALCIISNARADTTTLTAAGTSQGTSSTPVLMQFPIGRSGDVGYDVALTYHTVDVTAFAGIDYTAASGTIIVPADSTSASIPVMLAANTGSTPNLTFQLDLDAATGIGPAPSFATQQVFAAGGSPYSVTTADINGDGKLDFIVANNGSSTVSVQLNTTAPGAATPSFAPQQIFATGNGPYSVTSVDVNGDGKPDLIVANSFANTVSVLLNTTAPGADTPSFATQQTFATGNFSYAVTAADVNGDGKPDLIVANFNVDTVSVLLNTTTPGAATPSFTAQQTFATGVNPQSVSAVDVNGDGKPDLIVANLEGHEVSVLLNTTVPGAATPSFAAQQHFAVGNFSYSVTAADVNGDGKPDLIVTNFSDNTVSVLPNTTTPGATTPSFAAQQAFAVGSGSTSVTASVINGDGKPDLIVANYNSNTVSALLNFTAPGAAILTFATQQSFATGMNPQSVTVADVNGDGKPDLMIANYSDNTVSVLLNTVPPPTAAAPAFTAPQSFPSGSDPEVVTAVDVNGDGKRDLIVANAFDNTVSVLLSTTAPGAATASFAAQQTFAAGNAPRSVVASDLNGDGKPDLVVANYNDNTVSVLFNTTVTGATTPTFASQQTFATDRIPRCVISADLNGDGKTDLIVATMDGLGESTVSVLLNTTAPGAGTASFAALQTFVTTNGDSFSVAAADVNGDGSPDLIVTNINDQAVYVLLNTTGPGAITASFATAQSFTTGLNPHSIVTTDVNGDGRPDLIVANDFDNTVSVLLNTTAAGAAIPSFAAQQAFAVGNTFSVTTADVDGDGKPDLIVANSNDLTVSVLLNITAPGDATPSFAAQQTFASGFAYTVTMADMNGDGKPDLLVASGDNTVSVLLNTQYQATIAGSSATGTIVHDYIFANGFD